RNYLRALSRYGRVVTQRNGLLKSFARDRLQPGSINAVTQLAFWDEQLVSTGAYVIASRLCFVDRLSGLMQARSLGIIRDAVIDLSYVSKLDLGSIAENEPHDDVHRLTESVAARFHDQLAVKRPEEFRRGVTSIGPHRDDVMFGMNGRDLAIYGSRGQQRLGVVAIKLAEGDLIAGETGEKPILMLDDVLSELDGAHRDLLLHAVAGNDRQLIVTSTEHPPLDHSSLQYLPMVDVEAGRLR
ncbi:MAG TPA: hypothetical protein VFQ54_09760, partial [Thermomicrobiales bacterium]|nr:hypothetical protein [Thermomicrobiales bacterium]